MPHVARPVDERWLEKVDTSGGPDACHPWTGARVDQGYGTLRRGKDEGFRPIGTHVYAWVRVHGPVPAGMHVDHICHNLDLTCVGGPECPHRRCCNVAHLRVGTIGDNVRSGRSPELASIRITERNHARKGGPQQGGRRRA